MSIVLDIMNAKAHRLFSWLHHIFILFLNNTNVKRIVQKPLSNSFPDTVTQCECPYFSLTITSWK